MKTTTMILALALATTGVNAFAQSANTGAPEATEGSKWYQAGTRELSSEAEKAKLEHEGFPQYNR